MIMADAHAADVYFGGPDLPPRRLRDLLLAHVQAVPAGGTIDWVTYYFRDRGLAAALLDAAGRGVTVRVTIDGRPRTAHANDAVLAMLMGPGGMRDGMRLVRTRAVATAASRFQCRVHAKLYCFSDPQPVAFVGSYNPASDDPEEDLTALQQIGDHDRGDNFLVGLRAPILVDGLVAHARWVHGTGVPGLLGSLCSVNRDLVSGSTRVSFLPRLGFHPVARVLRRLGPTARVRIAGSHIKGNDVVRVLGEVVRRVASVEVIADPTLRRVSAATEERLRAAGIAFRRLRNPAGYPMHNKFVLVDEGRRRWVAFGSFNWTTQSFWMNHEICAVSEDAALVQAFEDRWQALDRRAGAGTPARSTQSRHHPAPVVIAIDEIRLPATGC